MKFWEDMIKAKDTLYGRKYSRTNEVKFVEDSL